MRTTKTIKMNWEKGEWIPYYNMPKSQMPRGKFTHEIKRLRGVGFKVRAFTSGDRRIIAIKEPKVRK
jgi:ribosomal protein L34